MEIFIQVLAIVFLVIIFILCVVVNMQSDGYNSREERFFSLGGAIIAVIVLIAVGRHLFG